MIDAAISVEDHLLNFVGFGHLGDLLASPGGFGSEIACSSRADGCGIRQSPTSGVIDQLACNMTQADLDRQTWPTGGAGDSGPDAGAAAIELGNSVIDHLILTFCCGLTGFTADPFLDILNTFAFVGFGFFQIA